MDNFICFKESLWWVVVNWFKNVHDLKFNEFDDEAIWWLHIIYISVLMCLYVYNYAMIFHFWWYHVVQRAPMDDLC